MDSTIVAADFSLHTDIAAQSASHLQAVDDCVLPQ